MLSGNCTSAYQNVANASESQITSDYGKKIQLIGIVSFFTSHSRSIADDIADDIADLTMKNDAHTFSSSSHNVWYEC